MRIGWVGLGSIGGAMVARLLATGHAVTAYPRGAGLAAAEAAGATRCGDYAALAAGSDLLVLCLYSDAQVRDVLFAGGALAALPLGATLVIHTTGAPELAREIGERALAGVSVLDATFSGGPDDVAAARLTIMAGGDAAALDRVRPVLGAYSATIHHVGPLGHGQSIKLLNNLLFATNLMNAAELLRLAQAQGFDAQTVARVVQACSGASYAMRLFDSAAPIDAALARAWPYLQKDVATVAVTAHDAGLDLERFAATLAYFRAA